jgi:hypothetical protein
LLPKYVEFWHACCLSECRPNGTQMSEGAMSVLLIFASKWNKWYRVLRYGKGFGLLDSARYGLWLARGQA